MSNIVVKINLHAYYARLVTALDGHIASLRNSLRSIEDGTYSEKANRANPEAIVRFEVEATSQELAEFERQKCIVGIVRSFVDFLDAMIAISKTKNDRVVLERAISGEDDLLKYIEEDMATRISSVGADRSLSSPKKLEMVGPLTEFSRKAAQGYLQLRNCLEHHKGVAQQKIELLFRKLTLVVNGETEIQRLPHLLRKGQRLAVTTRGSARLIEGGEKVTLTEQEVEDAAFTLRVVVAPEIVAAVMGSSLSLN